MGQIIQNLATKLRPLEKYNGGYQKHLWDSLSFGKTNMLNWKKFSLLDAQNKQRTYFRYCLHLREGTLGTFTAPSVRKVAEGLLGGNLRSIHVLRERWRCMYL